MSITGEASKHTRNIKNTVQNIALRGFTDREGGIAGTRKINGYVCKIHGPEEEDVELRNTVDVQEYNYFNEDEHAPAEQWSGYHEGVLLSAIQQNDNGFMMVPRLYSDVIIVQDPVDLKEYVYMYSHVQFIKMRSSEQIEIGVVATKDFVEGDDEIDVDDLEETGEKTTTTYDKDKVVTEVVTKDDGFTEETTATQRTIKVGDTTITIDKGNISIETKDAVNIKANNVKLEAKDVTITGGKLTTKGKANTDMNGPYTPIPVCPFSGAPHCGSLVSGT